MDNRGIDRSEGWPAAITDYLQRVVLEIRSPAFLLTDEGTRVVAHGGDLARYGLEGLSRGDPATEQAYFLEGLLPINGDRSPLSRVQTATGAFADIHLFRLEGADCVLLLDTSAEVAERTQIEQALRETEELLRQAEKMEALGRLAGGVAHDFNNLLTIILGYSQWLAEAAPGSEFQNAASEIFTAAKRATSVTQQLLSFSRRQPRYSEVLELNRVIAGVRDLLQKLIGEDIVLTAVLDRELACVEADRGQLEQVLMNLAANARDAIRGAGRLEVRTTNRAVDEAYLRNHPNLKLNYGPYVSMTVTDDGCGMDAETSARVFEPFFTSKPLGQGTGLGLSIVYGIIKQAGGEVMVSSAVGEGTRVEVLLPAVQKAATADPAAGTGPAVTGRETILLVEDEEGVRNLLRTTLTDLGYTVLACSDPLSAIELHREHGERIDLLITDLILPHMDGAKLAETITTKQPDVCVLYVSGYAPASVSQRCAKLPGGTFLGKPFTRVALADKVREALARKSHSAR